MATYDSTQASNPSNEVDEYAGPIVGFNSKIRSKKPRYEQGMDVLGAKGERWKYVKASAALAAGAVAATSAGVASAGTGYTATAAFASGDYGWVKVAAAF